MGKRGEVPRTGFISHPESPICELISSWALLAITLLGSELSILQLQGPHPEPQPLTTPSFPPRSQSGEEEQSGGQGRAGQESGPVPHKLTSLLTGLWHRVEGSG